MDRKVKVFCDIDDTIWDLLPVWVEYYNATHDEQVSDNLSNYSTWSFKGKVPDVDEFMRCLNSPHLWNLIRVSRERIDTLRWINDLFDVDLYIVTSAKVSHLTGKMKKFNELFPFISENQIIICHDKWVLDGDIWIDDKPQTLQECSNKGKTIKVNHAFNKNVKATMSINDFSDLYFNPQCKHKFKDMIYDEWKNKNPIYIY